MLHSLDVAVGDDATTVRNGFKWADLEQGEHIELCVCKQVEGMLDGTIDEIHDVQGEGKVERLWFGRFHQIPAWYLQFEHELRSREYGGLYDSMRKAYGNDFGENSPVTVILYERVK
jgi:hypothetical protein